MAQHLKNLSEIRRHFHRNDEPVYFVSATNFNLLGMDEWVKNFKYINYIDCYDGRHPNTLIPTEIPHDEFGGIEDINNYLLSHPEVRDYVIRRGGKPKFVFLMFDEETERLVAEIGGEIWFPPCELRNAVDDKIRTVRIGEAAGVPSVPNILIEIEGWDQLKEKAEEAGLGTDLVLQAAYGDSGKTTYFVASKEDFDKVKDDVVGEGEIKVMKRVDVRGSTIEACTTSQGTIVGPLMTELVGFSELTPNRGGWCGNEIFDDAFSAEVRSKARDMTFKFGEQLREEGYRGYFDLDFLIDKETGDVWLGELNPRITGASSMTNHAAFAHADAPLFLFHLLEFMDVTFELDISELNDRWADPAMIDPWSQMVLKHTRKTTELITAAPPTGIYQMARDGTVTFDRFDYHRRAVESEDEAFYLSIMKAGDYRYKGADLGILVTRGRSMTDAFELNDRARRWIHGLSRLFAAQPVETEQPAPSPFKVG